MARRKKELTLIEELLLNSLAFDDKCPHCGRAVHIEPKDLYWYIGVTIIHKDGTKERHEPGWRYECKCGKPIPVAISIGVDDDT